MAVTADVVEVRLRADTAQYVRNLNQADAAFTKTINHIDDAAGTARSSFSGVAAQFQDIGVTAAMGMNPLLIALQQGTQLSAQLQLSASNGQGVFKSLGQGIVGLINPISITTIAAIALGTALIQSLGSVLPASETANEALKRHKEALDKIVEGYEGAEGALDDYFDKANRVPAFAASAQLRQQFEEMAKTAEGFGKSIDSALEFLSNPEAQVGPFGAQLAELISRFRAGDLSVADFYGELVTLRKELPLVDQALSGMGLGLGALVNRLSDATEAFVRFGSEYERLIALSHSEVGLVSGVGDLQNALDLKTYIAEQERLNGLTADQLALEKEVARVKKDAGEFGITDERALEVAQQALAAEKARADARKAASAGDKLAAEYERERKAVTDLLEALGFEAALLGQSNREKAIAIALSKANKTATEEELAAIAQSAGFIYDTEQAIKDLNDTSQEWANTVESATKGFINDLIAGKDAAEAFGNVLSSIGNKLIDMGISSIFGTGGFDLASIFSGRGFPTRATGGNVYAGMPVHVNERGQETFIPTQPGRIVPASQSGSGGSVVFAPVINAPGADVAAVARLEQSMQKLASEVIPTIRREMATAGKKGRPIG
jgi:hypothetical protein